MQLGGPAKLVTILRSFNYEKLLYTTSSALKALADCSQAGTSTAQAIVDAGGIQALSLRLDHASQRLVIASLECLCAISDVRTDADVRETLAKLLQLLGVTDGRVVLHCLGILANMAANNPRNKVSSLSYLFNFESLKFTALFARLLIVFGVSDDD